MATVLEQEDTTTTQQAAGPVPAATAPEKGKRDKKQKQAQASAAAPAPAVDRKKWGVPGFLRSPWLLAAASLMIGGFWLVLNPGIIINNINQPYALLAGPALAGSFLACWLVVKFFEAIERGLRAALAAFLASRKEDGSAQFFWIVITVFLAVSVFASGDFFSKLEHDAIWGLGYATALFIDLVAVQCMRARLNAGRLRDRRGQFLYLLGVLICASASAFANVYTSLSTFAAPSGNAAGALPGWMSSLAPWFGLVFPILIVLLSMTADYTVDQTSSKLDPESYKREEGKRIKLLEYQRDLLRDRVGIEQEIDSLAAQLRGQKERRVFFLWAWLFPLQVSGARLLEQVEGLYKPQLDTLTEQNTRLSSELANLSATAQAAYAGLNQNLQHFIQIADSQRDTDNRLLLEKIEGLAAPEPDYKRLAEHIFPLLRQEVRTLAAAAPAPKLKINYTELARAVAPLLATGPEEPNELKEVTTEEIPATNGKEPHQTFGDTDELQVSDIEALASANGHTHEGETNETDENTDELTNLDANKLIQQPTVSLEEAAQLLKCNVKYVRTLRDRHKIKATPRNRERFTTESINLYLAERRQTVKA